MEKLSKCRICLVKDVRLHSLVNTELLEIYEFLSGNLLETKDTRPVHACYMCCARLLNCLRLRTACLLSEEFFSHLFENESCEVMPSQYMSVLQRAPVMHMNVNPEGHWELNIHPSLTTDEQLNVDWVEGAPVCKKSKLTALKEKEIEKKYQKIKGGIKETRNKRKILKTDKPAIENIIYCPSNEVENIFDKSHNEKTVVIEKNINTTSNFSDKLSKDNSTFNKQNQTYNDEEPPKCIVNDKRFHLKSKLQNKSSEKPYHKCDRCQKCFSLKSNLKRHLRTHTGEKPYKCDHCQKCFIAKGDLKRHLRTHTGEKPYKCDHCQKCFSRYISLKLHLRTHTDEKPYKCDHCQKCFSQYIHLKLHLRTHTGEKPYKCDHCQKCFSQFIHLKLHLRTHTGEKPYKCDHCKKCFSLKANLKDHLYTHTGEKPYKCDHCQKCFSDKRNLNRHLRTHKMKYEL